jgi:hypothetical protein
MRVVAGNALGVGKARGGVLLDFFNRFFAKQIGKIHKISLV